MHTWMNSIRTEGKGKLRVFKHSRRLFPRSEYFITGGGLASQFTMPVAGMSLPIKDAWTHHDDIKFLTAQFPLLQSVDAERW